MLITFNGLKLIIKKSLFRAEVGLVQATLYAPFGLVPCPLHYTTPCVPSPYPIPVTHFSLASASVGCGVRSPQAHWADSSRLLPIIMGPRPGARRPHYVLAHYRTYFPFVFINLYLSTTLDYAVDCLCPYFFTQPFSFDPRIFES